MLKPFLPAAVCFVLVLSGASASTYPESTDTVTVEDVTLPTAIAYDFFAPDEGGNPGQLGTHETTGVGNYNVVVPEGADSIWWAQKRIVLRPGTKIHQQTNNGFVWLAIDGDWDGVSDVEEALGVDGDQDGLPDGWEADYGLSVTSGSGNDGSSGDPDGDGVPNIIEYAINTNPQSANSSSPATVVEIF